MHYDRRSNNDAAHSAIQRNLSETSHSKDPRARINEEQAKLLANNIGVPVHEFFEHRIGPGVRASRRGVCWTNARLWLPRRRKHRHTIS